MARPGRFRPLTDGYWFVGYGLAEYCAAAWADGYDVAARADSIARGAREAAAAPLVSAAGAGGWSGSADERCAAAVAADVSSPTVAAINAAT